MAMAEIRRAWINYSKLPEYQCDTGPESEATQKTSAPDDGVEIT